VYVLFIKPQAPFPALVGLLVPDIAPLFIANLASETSGNTAFNGDPVRNMEFYLTVCKEGEQRPRKLNYIVEVVSLKKK
jgi:hypothetical protein